MRSQRILVGLVIMAAAGTAAAQTNATLRWRAGAPPLGLQAGAGDPRLPCSSYTFSCSGATTLPLYSSLTAPRTLSMQVTPGDTAMRAAPSPGLNVSVIGKAGLYQDLGVYGRVGTTVNRSTPALAGPSVREGGLTYGMGLSWDFSRSASASMGLDSYDIRGSLGDTREVRTSLGLQWRY